MKLRNIFTMLAAALAFAFVGCQEEERFLDEVQVSKSLVALPIAGGSEDISVNATADWSFGEIPEWLTVSPTSGAAGQTNVSFTVAAAEATNEAVLELICAGRTQNITVLQMAEKVETPITSCADVLKEKEVGKVYKVKGTVTDLTNYDKYGCFYVNDGTGEVYVYGSMNSAQFSPEVGDIITFEGPWTSYGNFDDATILSLEKSLIKLEKVFPAEALPLDGGVATVLLSIKEGDLVIEIPEDATWLTAGEPGKIGDMTSVELTASENTGGARSTTVTFKVNVGGKDYLAMANIEQLGAISEVTVKEFLAAEVGESLYKLTGRVSKLKTGDYGNFHLVDATGSVYVYGLTATPVEKNDKSFPTLGIKEGDIVTIVGTRDRYDGAKDETEKEQVGGPAYYVSHVSTKKATVAEFLAASEDETRYMLTGTISNIVMDKDDPTKQSAYGNFDLTDETGSVYVYGLTVAPVEKNDKSFPTLNLKEGDVVTLVGTRTSFNNKVQVGGPAYYVSHETPADDTDEDEDAGNDDVTSSGDVLTFESTGLTETTTTGYQDWTYTAASGAVYAGQSNAGYDDVVYIQLRSKNSNSGVVTTTSAGKVAKVILTWNSKTSEGRKVLVYGNSSAYTAPTDLYDEAKQGTKVGELEYAKEAVTELTVTGDYAYVGLRSEDGALYLDKIEVVWAE